MALYLCSGGKQSVSEDWLYYIENFGSDSNHGYLTGGLYLYDVKPFLDSATIDKNWSLLFNFTNLNVSSVTENPIISMGENSYTSGNYTSLWIYSKYTSDDHIYFKHRNIQKQNEYSLTEVDLGAAEEKDVLFQHKNDKLNVYVEENLISSLDWNPLTNGSVTTWLRKYNTNCKGILNKCGFKWDT